MRDATRELHHLQAALDIAARIRQHLAVLGREQRGQRVHVRLDQALELEQHSRPALGIERRPGRLSALCRLHCLAEESCIRQSDAGLHLPGVGIEDVAQPARRRVDRLAVDVVGYGAHGKRSRPGSCPAPVLTVA